MAKNILLDFVFPITAIIPTPAASTAFLKQAALVVKPKVGVTSGTVVEATTMSAVAAVTDNTEAQQLFAAGMTRVFVIAISTLDLETVLEANGQEFFTLLISSDFTEANVTADLDVGSWKGVIGVWTDDASFAEAQAAIENRVGFFGATANGAKNMLFAFGKLLSSTLNWMSQQYITMPVDDSITTLGQANSLFDDRVSFVLSDKQYGYRLGLFAVGGRAIVAPYVQKNLEIDIQSRAVQYITTNQPAYTKTQAALLQDELQKVIDTYVGRGWITSGSIAVELEQDNFVASAYMVVPEAKALWRIFGEVRQSAN